MWYFYAKLLVTLVCFSAVTTVAAMYASPVAVGAGAAVFIAGWSNGVMDVVLND